MRVKGIIKNIIKGCLFTFKCIVLIIIIPPFYVMFYITNENNLRTNLHENIRYWFKKQALKKKKQLPYIEYKGKKYKVGDKVKYFSNYYLEWREAIIEKLIYENKEAIRIKLSNGVYFDFPNEFISFKIFKIEPRKGPNWL